MQAIVITQPGGPEVLQIQERNKPVPAPSEVLIKVKAAGINRPDTFQRKGGYPPPAGAPPNIPGLEVAGVVEACGTSVTRWQPGDEVELQPQETLLVHGGSSGIGITAIQLARLWGARVFVTAGSPEKCAYCEALGAERAINYRTEDFAAVLKSEGIDVILDMVGGDYTRKNLELLNPDGRLVFINAMHGAPADFNIQHLMRRRLTITGSTLRPRSANFKGALAAAVEQHVWPWLESGQFKPVIYQQFPLAYAAQAHTVMESSAHIGKLVLNVEN